MKLMKGLAAAAVIVAMAACGGSDSTTNGGTTGTTPAATSAKALNALTNASMWMSETAALIPAALPTGGTSVKTTTGAMISCMGTMTGFECVLWDELGSATSADHKCDITGSYSETMYSFDLAYDCYTYQPDASVTVDGNWAATITVNYGSTEMAAEPVSLGIGKADAVSCDIDDISDVCGGSFSFEEGSCEVDCGGAASCTTAAAMATVDWTAGSRGVTTTDACGTYTIASGTTSSMAFCQPASTQFVMSWTVNGTINGTSIDESLNADCTMTSSAY